MNVTANPRGDRDGNTTQQFVDSIDTNLRTYNYEKEQSKINLWNKGFAQVTITIGSYSRTIDPLSTWEFNISFSLFTIKTVSGISEIQVTTQEAKECKTCTRQVSTKCMSYFRGLSDGVVNNVTYRMKHEIRTNCHDISFVYGNFYPSITAPYEIVGVNDITVKASLEFNSIAYPLTFNGQDSVVLKPGGFIKTDPISIYFKPDDVIYSRTYVSVSASGKFPIGATTLSADGEGETSGDITVTGTPTTNTKFAYSPLAIIGTTKVSSKSVYIFGDSISAGTGDTPVATGYIARGLMSTLPYNTMGMPSDKAMNAVNPYRYRKLFTAFNTHAIVEYAINDLPTRNLTQIQNDLTTIWSEFKNRGLKVFQCTITPKTTSSDSWATVANQTPFAQDSIRVQLNEWIRTCPTPLDGYFEIADLAESARNSGRWKAGYTGDGTHPNQTGHIALSAGIDTTRLV